MEALLEKKQMYRVISPNQDKRFEAKFDDYEQKMYLVCCAFYNNIYDGTLWVIKQGRTEAYEYVKELIEDYSDTIDFEESFVLVDGLPLSDRKNLYVFIKYIQQFYDDGFDVDEYIDEEDRKSIITPVYPQASELPNMPVNPIFDQTKGGITMEEFMNGERFIEI